MAAALTLIEILIALFIFMVGCLGVLSIFPVAMNNAGRVMGETRGNILAQSVMAQLTADCRVNFELPATGSAAAVTVSASPNPNYSFLQRQPGPPPPPLINPPATYPNPPTPPPLPKTGYFVTLLDGPGRGQSRLVIADQSTLANPQWGTAMTVAPAWTPVFVTDNATPTPNTATWWGPGSLPTPTGSPYFPNEHYSITRMGMPERPLTAGEQILQGGKTYSLAPPVPTTPYFVAPAPTVPPTVPPATLQPWPTGYPYAYGTFGLNRDLAVRSFITASNGFTAPKPASGNNGNGLVNGFAPNGFFAGIANPLRNPQTIPVDAFVSYYGTATAIVSPNPSDPLKALYDPTGAEWLTNLPLSNHYQVRIVRGSGAGQARFVTGLDSADPTNHTLLVSPNWATPLDSSSWYEIGWANTDPAPALPPPAPRDFTWCTMLRLLMNPPNNAAWRPSAADLPHPNHIIRGDPFNSLTDLTGKYVYLTGGTGAGQARAILSNDASDIYVTPSFMPPPDTTTSYELMESHGYVLITSGRATNRLFPIVWDQSDQSVPPAEGHFIVCAGTNFQSLDGITAASSSPAYNLQNATTFTVIGNQSPFLGQQTPWVGPTYPGLCAAGIPAGCAPDDSDDSKRHAHRLSDHSYSLVRLCALSSGSAPPTPYYHWSNPPPPSVWPPPWFNNLNIVGHPYRMVSDQYNGATNTFEYNYGAVFSDTGIDSSLPMRVDVFVWRNFDLNKDFAENQKPVGHMAGYIRRP